MNETFFWNKVHTEDSKLWLTKTPPQGVFSLHQIILPLAGSRILDIGIGDGSMHRYLDSLGYDVWSEDISEVALAKVCHGIRESEIRAHGPWDLVICHLVFQHMADEQIQNLVSEIDLKPRGIASFQFAELMTPADNWPHHYFRDLKTMLQILDTRFKTARVLGPLDYAWEGETVRWWILHETL